MEKKTRSNPKKKKKRHVWWLTRFYRLELRWKLEYLYYSPLRKWANRLHPVLFMCKIKLIHDVYRLGRWRVYTFSEAHVFIYCLCIIYKQIFMNVSVKAFCSYQLTLQFWGSPTPAPFFPPLFNFFKIKFSFKSSTVTMFRPSKSPPSHFHLPCDSDPLWSWAFSE